MSWTHGWIRRKTNIDHLVPAEAWYHYGPLVCGPRAAVKFLVGGSRDGPERAMVGKADLPGPSSLLPRIPTVARMKQTGTP